MDSQKVDMFIMKYSSYFSADKIPFIRKQLLILDELNFNPRYVLRFKRPSTALLISFFLGPIGFDRFYIGDIALGIVKMITCGGLGVWTLIDWFMIVSETRKRNLERLVTYIS